MVAKLAGITSEERFVTDDQEIPGTGSVSRLLFQQVRERFAYHFLLLRIGL
jgi:hypothetical protein